LTTSDAAADAGRIHWLHHKLSAAAYAFYTQTPGKLLLVSLLLFIASHAFGQGRSFGCSSVKSSPIVSAPAARR